MATSTLRSALVALFLARAALATQSLTPSSADYCATATETLPASGIIMIPTDPTEVVPPLPCNGYYEVQEGRCCKFDNTTDGLLGVPCGSRPELVQWELPLAPCVSANAGWSGCPGNMQAGTCCNGAGVAMEYPATGSASQSGAVPTASCADGVAFVVTTSNGTAVTSTPGAAAPTGNLTAPTGNTTVVTASVPPVATEPPKSTTTSNNGAGPTPEAHGLARVALIGAVGALIVAW